MPGFKFKNNSVLAFISHFTDAMGTYKYIFQYILIFKTLVMEIHSWDNDAVIRQGFQYLKKSAGMFQLCFTLFMAR